MNQHEREQESLKKLTEIESERYLAVPVLEVEADWEREES